MTWLQSNRFSGGRSMSRAEQSRRPAAAATCAERTCWWRHVTSTARDCRRPIVVRATVDGRRQRSSRQSEISKIQIDRHHGEKRHGQPGQEQHDCVSAVPSISAKYQPVVGVRSETLIVQFRASWLAWLTRAPSRQTAAFQSGDAAKVCATPGIWFCFRAPDARSPSERCPRAGPHRHRAPAPQQ